MTIDLEEFRGYLLIDKNALDQELVQQPSLFEKVGDAFAEAIAEKDAAKEELANVDARLDGMIRKSAADKRVTDTAIKNRIQAHSKHQGAFAKYLTAKMRADKLGALKESFHQRSYMLRELAGLAVSNYFEGTSVKATPTTNRAIYSRQRERLAEARQARETQ